MCASLVKALVDVVRKDSEAQPRLLARRRQDPLPQLFEGGRAVREAPGHHDDGEDKAEEREDDGVGDELFVALDLEEGGHLLPLEAFQLRGLIVSAADLSADVLKEMAGKYLGKPVEI